MPVNINVGMGSVGVRVRKFWEYFFVISHSSSYAPTASSLSSGLVIAASIIGQGGVVGVRWVDDSIVPPLFPTPFWYSRSSIICVDNEYGYRGGINVKVQ